MVACSPNVYWHVKIYKDNYRNYKPVNHVPGVTWISNHMPSKVWNEIAYPSRNFNGYAVEVSEWIIYFIPHFIMDVITYACWDYS